MSGVFLVHPLLDLHMGKGMHSFIILGYCKCKCILCVCAGWCSGYSPTQLPRCSLVWCRSCLLFSTRVTLTAHIVFVYKSFFVSLSKVSNDIVGEKLWCTIICMINILNALCITWKAVNKVKELPELGVWKCFSHSWLASFCQKSTGFRSGMLRPWRSINKISHDISLKRMWAVVLFHTDSCGQYACQIKCLLQK